MTWYVIKPNGRDPVRDWNVAADDRGYPDRLAATCAAERLALNDPGPSFLVVHVIARIRGKARPIPPPIVDVDAEDIA